MRIENRVALLFVTAATLLVSAGAAKSQELPGNTNTNDSLVTIGSRVRLSVENPRKRFTRRLKTSRFVGTITKLGNDSVGITIGLTKMDFHVHSIAKFEIYDGTRPRVLKGAFLGLVIGTGAGLFTGFIVCSSDGSRKDGSSNGFIDFDFADLEKTLCIVRTTVGGAVLGSAIGTIIGLDSKQDKWKSIDVSRLNVGIAPVRHDALGVSLSLSF